MPAFAAGREVISVSSNSRPARTKREAIAQRKKQQSFVKRYRGMILGVAGVIVFGGLIVVAGLQASANRNDRSLDSSPLDPAVFQSLVSVPNSVFQEVGTGTASNPPQRIQGTALTEDGKPEILYVGAEFCPFCAAERWPLFLALSRFGSFTGLLESYSAADDSFPNTPTLSFYGSTYQSDYLAFTPVETATNEREGGRYKPLQSLTEEQEGIMFRYNNGGGIPFIYLGGDFILKGANFSPNLLTGLTFEQIADRIGDPSTQLGKAVVGSANVITAALCELTGGEPGSVCQSPEVVSAASRLQ